jgi:hypothetical protein
MSPYERNPHRPKKNARAVNAWAFLFQDLKKAD